MTGPSVKICGVRDAQTAIAAARSGADFLGFVFFRKSPRHVGAEEAEEIILALKEASFEEGFDLPKLVGLFVDAGEKELSVTAPLLTHFQFHGHEPPERCRELGEEFAVEVIKAIPVAAAADIAKAKSYEGEADILLFDAKPPPGATRPGGHGASFDWSLLAAYEGETPYFVAGGLTPATVAAAVKAQKNHPAFLGVDVSSGVESALGEKDLKLVEAFVLKVKSLK